MKCDLSSSYFIGIRLFCGRRQTNTQNDDDLFDDQHNEQEIKTDEKHCSFHSPVLPKRREKKKNELRMDKKYDGFKK